MVSRFVGIDLGAHNTVVASSNEAEPFVISLDTNDLSNRATPTMFGLDARQILVGEAAESKASSRPKQIVPELLAALGSEADSRMKRFSCSYSSGELGPLAFGDKEIAVKAQHALGLYLEKLISFGRQGAEKAELCVSVSDAMSDSEVQMVFEALSLVGGARVLRHSTAMQLAYIHKERAVLLENPKTVLLVNVGFGYSSATLATFTVEDGEVVSTGVTEATPVGISSFLDSMVAHCSSIVEQKHKRKVEAGSKQEMRLRTALQKSLKDLSMLPDTTMHLECFFPDDDIDVKIDLSRDILSDLIAKDTAAIAELIPKVLTKAEKSLEDLSSVEVVGGGSRVVAVQQAIQSSLTEGMTLGSGLDSSSCVAVGSAYFMAALQHRSASAKGDIQAPAEVADLGVKELDAWIKGIHDLEQKRLGVENEFEAYLYKVQSWLSGPDKDLLQPAAPMVDGWRSWLEDAQCEDTAFETLDTKFKEVKDFMQEKCAAYFEKVEQDRLAKEKELDEAAEKERQRRKELGMDNDKDDRTMPKAERLRLGESNKAEGTELLQAGKFDDAIRRYKKAVDHVSRPEVAQNLSPEEKEQADKIKTGCYLNMALCYTKAAAQVETEKGKNEAEPYYKKAKNALDDCLELNEANVKARFRRANIWEKLGDIDKAMSDIKAALKVEPEDKDLLKSKERFEKLQNKQKEAQKKMYGKMFG